MEAKPQITPTGVRVRFQRPTGNEPPFLLAYCQLEIAIPGLGMFVCHSLRLIRGRSGEYRVEFPFTRVNRPCARCRMSAITGARYCHHCGAPREPDDAKWRDEFHPANLPSREAIAAYIVQEYRNGGFDGP